MSASCDRSVRLTYSNASAPLAVDERWARRPRKMHIGIFALLTNPIATPAYVEAVGTTSEACGFHSLWVGEHVVLFDDFTSRYPYSADGRLRLPPAAGMLEPLTTLCLLGACTKRIRLGTGIYILPQHNPVAAAKEIANLDWLSEGRVDLGIGIGWSRQEYSALAAPWSEPLCRRAAAARGGR